MLVCTPNLATEIYLADILVSFCPKFVATLQLDSRGCFYIDRSSSLSLDDIVDCLYFFAVFNFLVFNFLTLQVWAEERDLIISTVEKCPGDTMIDSGVCPGNISLNEGEMEKVCGVQHT